MKTMCPPGYHHNGFVATHALGHMMYIYMIYIYIHMIYIYIHTHIHPYLITGYHVYTVISVLRFFDH